MLSIGKLGATRGQLQYYERQVATGMEDYYAGRGESRGVWRGSGLRALGLSPGEAVERAGFMALMHGCSPRDGGVLREMGRSSRVAGLDLTFSAPKSVSVLFAVGGAELTAALLGAHESAVDEALAFLEREACWTRRGHGGIERLRGEGFVAASYRHRTSRAGDPQLHTHVVIGNLTRAEGRYTAVDAHALYEHKSAAGAIYRAALRAEVCDRLPWVRWRSTARGLFEVDGVPDQVLRHFSQRRAEIEDRAAELAGSRRERLSRSRMEGIALVTRAPKPRLVSHEDWREDARARAAEHGLGASEIEALAARSPVSDDEPDLPDLFQRLGGASGLTELHNTFARRHAVAELAGAFPAGARLGHLDEVADRFLADPAVRPVGPGSSGERRFTTRGLLACESAIVESTARRSREQTARLSSVLVHRCLARHQPQLTCEQSAAVHAVTSSGRGIEVVCALAGTGKTMVAAALRACYAEAGYRVIGATPTARAARELRDVAGMPAGTMHSLLAELNRSEGLGERTVLVIDEAGMAPTRITASIFAHAERAGAKIIAIGDPGQLPSVEAGGWLAALAGRQPGPELRQVIRQRDPAERRALEALHSGQPEVYLNHKRDAVAVHQEEDQAVTAVIDQWDAARRAHGLEAARMIARDNFMREQLNRAARARLKAEGALPHRGVQVGEREYSTGDLIVARRNDYRADIDNGTVARVLSIDHQIQRMRVTTSSGDLRELDFSYVASHVEHAYALTAHGAQGATLEWAGVIGRPTDFTSEWAYTALSRARHQTILHIVAEPGPRARERAAYAPAESAPLAAEAMKSLLRTMRQGDAELLALDQQQLHAAVAAGRRACRVSSSISRRNTLGIRPPSAATPTVRSWL